MPRLLLAISLVCSTLYCYTFVNGSFDGRWAVKAASIFVLAIYARRDLLLALALALGSLGDALLDISSQYFVHGLLAFLAGHIVYTVFFHRAGRLRPQPWVLLALAAYAAVFVVWLWPSLGPMRIPVMVYILAITTMAANSFRVSNLVALGAVLFLVSDSLLAANRFKVQLPLRDWLVWLPYYGAQLSLAIGGLRARSR